MLRGLLFSIISGLGFACLPILGKLAYAHGMDVNLILQSRFTVGGLLLLAWFAATDRSVLRCSPKTLLKAATLGLVFYPVQSWLFMSAVERIPASTPTLILYFYPVAVTLLCALFFRQRVSLRTVASLALVTLGCCLVFYEAFLARVDGLGLVYAVGSTLVFSLYLVAVEVFMRGERPLTMTLYVISVAGVFWCACSGGPGAYLALDAGGLGVALALGLITGVFAVAFLYKAVECIGSPMASIFSTVEPVGAVLLAWLVLGDPLAWPSVAGMVLIVAGIVWPNLRLLRRHPVLLETT